MAKKVNKKKSAKSVKVSSFSRAAHGRRPRRQSLIFALFFAIIGTILLLKSFAQDNNLPPKDNDIVAAYVSEKPTRVIRDAAGKDIYESYSATYLVLSDGTLLCDNGNSEGNVNTASIGRGQVRKIQADIANIDLSKVPAESPAVNGGTRINIFEGYAFFDHGRAKGFAVYEGGTKSDKLFKMQEKILKACSQAVQKQPRGKTKKYNLPRLSAGIDLNQTITQKLASKAFPKVHAYCSNANCNLVEDTNAENFVHYIVNTERINRGRQPLSRNGCLNYIAQSWTRSMAITGYLTHNDSLNSQIVATCHTNPWAWAENIAYQSSSRDPAETMSRWFSSAGHYGNIVNPSFRYTGIGVFVNTATGLRWYTQTFANW